MLEDRRQYPRLILDSPVLTSLGKSKSERLLNLCEGGLAVDGLAPENRDEVISLAFDLPEDNGHIQARAKIAWTSDSGHRTGLRFVDLADTSRQQLRNWILATVDTTGLATTEEGPAEPVFISHVRDALVSRLKSAEVPPQLRSESEPEKPNVRGDEGLSRYGKLRHLTGLFLTGVLVSSAFVFSLGYYLASMWYNRQAKSPAAAKVPQPTSKGSMAPVNQSPATTPSLPPTISLDRPGFVLQAGAMTHEDNADELARALRQRNLPAFVFRRGTDRFYIVAVGPYSDADSTVTVKAELEGQGFQVILRRWSPE
ncbi:MAG: PilZ domain-containing protein [Candidatus Acidiferrales bacterium]